MEPILGVNSSLPFLFYMYYVIQGSGFNIYICNANNNMYIL